jgi:23S rRNA (cytosine1962-C5)-methyltransferase
MTTYKLLDSGNQRKLEQVGDYVIIRPAPQAIWEPFTPEIWKNADSEFVKEKGEKGMWKGLKNPEGVKRNKLGAGIDDSWNVVSPNGLKYFIEPNDFGNIGIFPEHWIYSNDLPKLLPARAKVLNVFTYTGSNALDLVKAGCDVTVVDSAKTAMNTYTHNLDANKLSRKGQRLILEDANKFLEREIRRGSTYDCVMVDAPSYGRGTKNEVFDIEFHLIKLMQAAKKLTTSDGTIIITLHSPRFTLAALKQTVEQMFKGRKEINIQELNLKAENGSYLTSGMLIQVH